MESLNEILSNFDEIEIPCVIHNLPTVGLCGEHYCQKSPIFYCMKCIKNGESCITKEKHELITFSEFLYRFFIKIENKTIDLVQINSMIETIKYYEPKELQDVLTNFITESHKIIDKVKFDLDSTTNVNIQKIQSDNNEKINELNNMLISAQKDEKNIDKLLNVNIPNILVQSVFSNQNTLDLVTSSMKNPKEKDKFIVDIKLLSDIENTIQTSEKLNNLLYVNDTINKTENDLSNEIDSILNSLEKEFDKKLEDIEKSLIIPKDNNLFLFIKNKITSFNSNPSNLIYNKDICNTAHKTNSIDSVFSAFKSLKGESLIIWGTPQCSIECYDLGLDKIVKTVHSAHSQTIFSCRHYLDRKGKRDLVITSSYDRCIKVWDIKNNWANIVNIPTAHTGYYIYSVCILCDEKDENYIISSAPNEYCKIWNFKGVYLRNFGVNNESTYFVDAYYDYKECKYYILNDNSCDVKSYDFKTGKLYKSYKGTPQTWHMSALVYEINEVQTLLESDGNGYIRLWDFHTGLLIKSIYSGSVINLRGICIWNEQYLFSTGSDYQVKLFDLKNGKYVKGFSGHTSTVCVVDKIECSKYGECLISHGLDGKLKLWTISQN